MGSSPVAGSSPKFCHGVYYCDDQHTAVTAWSRWDEDRQEYVFNHLEDGCTEAEHPTPKFSDQKWWPDAVWERRVGVLNYE